MGWGLETGNPQIFQVGPLPPVFCVFTVFYYILSWLFIITKISSVFDNGIKERLNYKCAAVGTKIKTIKAPLHEAALHAISHAIHFTRTYPGESHENWYLNACDHH